jgi:microcystin-dependent protein
VKNVLLFGWRFNMGYSVTTGPLQLPFPDGAEDLDIPGDIQLLAQQVDDKVTQRISDNVVLSAELFLTETPPAPNVQVVDSKMNIYMTPPDLSSKLSRSGGTMTGGIVMADSAITFTGTGSITVPTPTAVGHAATKAYVDTRIPIGGVIQFAGPVASIPAGWYMCDGTAFPVNSSTAAIRAMIGNNKPDLRGLFVIGSTGDTGTYATGSSHGAGSVTLTESNLPSHTHTINSSDAAHSHGGSSATAGGSKTPAGSVSTTDTNHTHSGGTGGASADHSHSGTTSWMDRNASHAHAALTREGLTTGDSEWYIDTADGAAEIRWNTVQVQSTDTNHLHGFSTGGHSADHSHGFTTGYKNSNASHAHTFSGSAMDINHSHTVTVNSGNATHAHTATNTGGGSAFAITPPAYALIYIVYGGA